MGRAQALPQAHNLPGLHLWFTLPMVAAKDIVVME